MESPDWWKKARCNDGAGTMSELFFSTEPPDIAKAKRICAECDLIEPCLKSALDDRVPEGIWGGQLFFDGKIVARPKYKGHPTKVPRANDWPDIPIPESLLPRIQYERNYV